MIHRGLWTLFWRASQRGLVPDEEFLPVRTKITPPPSRMPAWMPARSSQGRLAALAALALVAVLVAAATIGQEVRLLTAKTTTSSTTSGVAGTATPRPTPTPTFAPLPTVLPAGQGWAKTTGPDYAAAVAIAPGQPATLYTCSSDLDPHPKLGLSHDGGRTWQTSTLPASCEALEVSPANAQDLAFSGEKCQLSSAAAATSAGKFGSRAPRGEDVVVGPIPPIRGISTSRADDILPNVSGQRQDGCATISIKSWAYVSADGGKHWTQANLPPNAIDAPEFVGYLIAWVGTTLFVAPNYINLPPDVHTLAASTNGGPFVWVDQNGLSGRVPVWHDALQSHLSRRYALRHL